MISIQVIKWSFYYNPIPLKIDKYFQCVGGMHGFS